MNEEQSNKEASLEIRNQTGAEIFKIGARGEVFWRPAGEEMVRAKTDEELGKALALCVMQLSGMDYVRLIEVYLGESTRAFRELLIKKIMEMNSKSKSIKKSELVKIIDEFKI
jgi:hypothetical protein